MGPHTRGIVVSALLTALRPHPVKRQGPRSGEVLVGKKEKVEVEVQYRCGSMRATCLRYSTLPSFHPSSSQRTEENSFQLT